MKYNLENELLPANLVTYGLSNEFAENDVRQELFKQQRAERGFDDSEAYSFDVAIAKFIYPRLKAFIPIFMGGVPSKLAVKHGENYEAASAEWKEILESMLAAFEYAANNQKYFCMSGADKEMFEKGMQYFAEYYHSLWD